MDFGTHPFEPSLGVSLQLLIERAQHRRRSFDEHHPGLTSVELVITARQHTVSQLGDLADELVCLMRCAAASISGVKLDARSLAVSPAV
jgi:hypothetical protein